MGCKPIAGHHHTPSTHTYNLVTPINLHMFLDCGILEYPEETAQRHGVNMQTSHTWVLGGDLSTAFIGVR